MHISAELIDNFPLPYSPWSWDKEKLSIPLEAHHKAQSSELFLSKTHVIRRTFKGFWKVYGWMSFVKGQANFAQRVVHRLGKTVLHTCSDLFKPVQNFSHLFTNVHTFSYLFTPVHTCSHLSDYLRCSCNGSSSLNIPLVKAVIFRTYVPDPRFPADV